MQNKKEVSRKLSKAHLLKEYASWIYCDGCGKTVGYLCYVTYSYFKYEFFCKCGSKGLVELTLGNEQDSTEGDSLLFLRKNRYCCPKDDSPLFSIVDKNLIGYNLEVVCKSCRNHFRLRQDQII